MIPAAKRAGIRAPPGRARCRRDRGAPACSVCPAMVAIRSWTVPLPGSVTAAPAIAPSPVIGSTNCEDSDGPAGRAADGPRVELTHRGIVVALYPALRHRRMMAGCR